MSKGRRAIPISESQAAANASAVYRREREWSIPHDASVRVSMDFRQRIPDDLRGLVRAARRAYEDEVPTKLHDAQIGEGGTPQLTERFVGYLDRPGATDAPPGERPLASYHLTPFRATLDRMEKGDVAFRRKGAIVRHITIGSQTPFAAATAEGAHPLDATDVATIALRAFFGAYSDLKLDLHRTTEAA